MNIPIKIWFDVVGLESIIIKMPYIPRVGEFISMPPYSLKNNKGEKVEDLDFQVDYVDYKFNENLDFSHIEINLIEMQ